MKLNRLTSIVAALLAVLVIVGQLIGSGAQAAPPPHYSASVSARLGNGSATSPASPNTQNNGFTVQGRLTDASGHPITSSQIVTFTLYDASSGGNNMGQWNYTFTPDSNGLFSVTLGGISSVTNFANPLYLGIKVGSDLEMTPRFALMGAPFAFSLYPGAMAKGNYSGSNGQYGVINGVNTDRSSSANAGVYGEGAVGVAGFGYSTGNSGGDGGYFHNYGGGSGSQYGVWSQSPGYGLYATSDSNASGQQSAGVVGVSTVASGAGGVFTDTAASSTGVVGFGTLDGISGYGQQSGVLGTVSPGGNGAGVRGNGASGSPSSLGGFFNSYDYGAAHLGLQVDGQGHATGGFSTGLGYYMTVKYDGADELHPGDILSLDGNNSTIDGVNILGTVKATTDNASAAIGVVHYRYNVYESDSPNGHQHIEQLDTAATSIKAGDFVQIVIAGQAQARVSGNPSIGDRLAIGSSGSVAATKDSANSIGKLASKPDANGMASVIVNFK